MQMWTKMTVNGLYAFDETIFDPLVMPGDLGKDEFIALIMQECSELPVTFPNPYLFKKMLSAFVGRKLPIWQKLYETMNYSYNPIDNYDRYEDTKDRTLAKTDHTRNGNTTGTGETRNKNSAFPDNEMVDTSQQNGNTRTDTIESLRGDDDTNYTRLSHIHGNIGVMSTQELIERQRESVRFNLYQEMVSDFCETFCVRVY